MPIDPSIALGVRPMQIQLEDPVAKTLSLGNMIQKGQLQGEQIKGAQLENQQHQLGLDQTTALNAAYQDALTVGPDGTPTIDTGKLTQALGKGGHGSAIPGVLKGVMDFQKAGSELSKLNTEVAEKRADYGGIVGATMSAANHDPRLFLVKAQQAMQSKALPAEMVQPYIDKVGQLLEQDPTGEQARQLVKQISDQLIAASPAQQKLINEATTAAAAKSRATSAATSAQTGADKFATEKPGLQAKADTEQLQNAAQQLGAATDQAGYAAVWNQLPAGIATKFPPPGQFDPKTTPAQVRQLGMSPHEQESAITAAKNAENNVSEYELELRAAKGDANAKTALANRQRDRIAAVIAGRDPSVRLDHEINQYGKPFDEMVKGTDGQLDKILDAEKMVAGGAVSQALAIPKVLSALVSGQGSGVRITQAELNSIAQARGLTGNIEGFFSKLKGDGVLTAEQKKQMQGILEDVRSRIVEKKMIARGAQDEMLAATDRQGVLAAANKGRTALDAHAAKGSAAASGGLSTGHKVGEVVNVGGRKVKITKILPGDKFEGDEVH